MSPNPAILTWPHVAPSGVGELSVTYLGTVTGPATNSTTATFSSAPLGTADATRTIIVAVATRGSGSDHATVTVAGVGATRDTYIVASVQAISIWRAQVPTGTTGTITATFGSAEWAGIGLWSITGDAVAATDSATYTGYPPSPLALSVTSGDVAVAALSIDRDSGITWTNATERYETAISAASTARIMSGADAAIETTGTLTVSTSHASAPDTAATAVAYTPA